ncbi:MAG TPA: MFS transporter, partial [Actinospica sp.]|nr:MFS transporter [Actinospica sp.]
SRAFSAANLVTFAVYAALSGVMFLVVLNLQVVVGFTALDAGISMLPVTVLMLLLSARGGALSQRIGPRIPMTAGPIVCAGALLLFSRIGAHATYLPDVLPAVVTLGLGLSLTVAPLTATALGAVDERHAGIASGVNNAVARAAGLLAVAILPLAAGLGGGSLTIAGDLGPMYRRAMLICAGLLLVGAGTAFASIPTKIPAKDTPPEEQQDEAPHHYCAIAGTPLGGHRDRRDAPADAAVDDH